MRIAFDHQAFCLQTTGGISRYFSKLAEMLDIQGQTVGIFAPLFRNQYLTNLSRRIVHGYHVNAYPPKMAGLCVHANRILASNQIGRWQPDIIHETYFSNHPVALIDRPRVLTVFDMIGELGLDGLALSQNQIKASAKYRAVQRADHVICISQATCADLIKVFGMSADKISVVYLGCDSFTTAFSAEQSTKSDQRPFLLYVGIRQGYKNFKRFLTAVGQTPSLLRDFDVIAFGGGVFTTEENALIQTLGFRPGQVRQESGNDRILAFMYRRASAFVYPSEYEGFGIPLLEAMMQGCPVVCADNSSLPEVVGEAGEFFDALDTGSIAQAIARVVYSPERTKELITSGHRQVTRFTWKNCAEQHLEIYRTLVQMHSSN